MFSIGKEPDSTHIDNLKNILEHLMKLTPYDRLLDLDYDTDQTEKESEPDITVNVTEKQKIQKKIFKLLERPFLPRFLVVFDDVWNPQELASYDGMDIYGLVTSRRVDILDRYGKKSVTKVSDSESLNVLMNVFYSKILRIAFQCKNVMADERYIIRCHQDENLLL